MSQNIKISDELYSRLAKHAEGFDTPVNVIERLLNHYEGIPEAEISRGNNNWNSRGQKDTSKYLFNGNKYGKGRLVLAVVKEYISQNSDVSFSDLLSKFPKHLQGSTGVIDNHDVVQEKFKNIRHKRHFLESDEIIQLSDCSAVVSTEWGIANIENFISQAESLGFSIDFTNN